MNSKIYLTCLSLYKIPVTRKLVTNKTLSLGYSMIKVYVVSIQTNTYFRMYLTTL